MPTAKPLLLSLGLGLAIALAGLSPARAAGTGPTSDFADLFPVPTTLATAQTALAVATLPGLNAGTALVLANLPGASSLYPADSGHLSLASQTVYNLVSPLLADNPSAAVEVAIVSPYGTATYGFGSAHGAGSAAPDGDSLFAIGSVTKTFTGTLVAKAVLDGAIAMDAPAQAYMPAGISLPTFNGTPVTMTDLVTHTSGLPTDVRNADGTVTLDPGFSRFAATVNDARLTYQPGTIWDYSNVGATLAGLAVETVSGASYESLLQKEILGPLGMADTTSLPVADQAGRKVQGYAYQGQPATTTFTDPSGSLEDPAGSITSTANDLIRYMQANLGLSASTIGPAMLLAQQPLFTVTSQNSAVSIRLGQDTADTVLWSMGDFWLRTPVGASDLVNHPGAVDGIMTNVVMDPFTKTGVVLMYNQFQFTGATPASTLEAVALSTQSSVTSISQDILDTQVALERTAALAMGH